MAVCKRDIPPRKVKVQSHFLVYLIMHNNLSILSQHFAVTKLVIQVLTHFFKILWAIRHAVNESLVFIESFVLKMRIIYFNMTDCTRIVITK
jgi:hypothetical protein